MSHLCVLNRHMSYGAMVTKCGVCLETKRRCILHRSWAGYICTCARADVPPFPYLGNGWTDCAEIWCVARDPLARLFAKVHGGAQLHVSTCAPLFRISETAGTDCAEIWYVVRGPLAKRFTKNDVRYGTCSRAACMCVLHRMGDSALTQV